MNDKTNDVYGLCPICGAPGVTRERRPGGNDTCKAGHCYPSRDARVQRQSPQESQAPTRADVPAAAAACFDALTRAAIQGALLFVPLVAPSGRIVYSVGAIPADGVGGYLPLAYILAPEQTEGMRQATRADLEAAGHIAQAPAIVVPH